MKNHVRTDQKGIVSIVVAMLVMIVISLIVISFARTSRRERRQVLDRQLNTQAFYAAETGINDAVKFLETNPDTPKEDCEPGSDFPNAQLSNTANSGYSCILIDPYPDSLQYDTIGTGGSKVIPIQPHPYDPSDPVSSINISWQAKEDPNNSSACKDDADVSNLEPASSWPSGCPGMLRLDLIPISSTFDRTQLTENVMTTFLLPNKGGGVPVPGTCQNPAIPVWEAQKAAYDQALITYNQRKQAHDAAVAQYNQDYEDYEWDRWVWEGMWWWPWRGPAPQPPTPVPPFTETPPVDPGPRPTPETVPCLGPAPTSTINYNNSNGPGDNTGFPNQGEIKVIFCDNAKTPYQCNVKIQNLPNTGQYVVRLRSIYRPSIVNLTAMKTSDPNQKYNLRGAQAIVDVTGRASDVLRRVNVRVPTSTLGNGIFPDYAVLSVDNLCKRFGVAPNLAPIYSPIENPDGSTTPFPPECQL